MTYLSKSYDAALRENETLREERDALASFRYRVAHYVFRYRGGHFDAEALADAMTALDSTNPNASIDRLRAEWQADAVDDSAEGLEIDGRYLEAAQALRHTAAELRRQAEGGQDG